MEQNVWCDEVADPADCRWTGAGPLNTVVMFPIELTETVKKLVETFPQKHGDQPAP